MPGIAMQKRLSGTWAMLALFALTACETPAPGTAPSQGANNLPNARQVAQAERLSREQQYVAAAQLYEDLANRSSGAIRSRFQLRAATDYLRANDTARGTALLTEAHDHVPPADYGLRSLADARVALAANLPQQTLAELDRLSQPWPRDTAPEILELRARALFANGNPAGAVIAALDRERLLTDNAAIMNNRRMIWDGVQQSVAAGVNMQAPVGASRTVAGWLDIGTPALVATRNPFDAHPAIDAWRLKYPEHPANDFLNQQVMPQLRAAITFPAQIALVLPLSGNQQAAGQVVRDGFMAAVLQMSSEQRPLVRIYDSAAGGVLNAYALAVNDGAKFVVGPLIKEDVATLVNSQSLSVPTLVLNSLPERTAATPNLFDFWPDPTDEARQVARYIGAQGFTHGVAIVPKSDPRNDWGDRVLRAFIDELATNGGTVVGHSTYDRRARDFREPVMQVLLIDESNSRARALSNVLGTKLEFEPRRRNDIQFIFVGAEAAQGRLLQPQLRHHLIDPLPVFATSIIYEPDATANADLDGITFLDMPWLIAPDEQAVQLRAALNRYWPGRSRERGRLYALGYDTFRLIPLLLSQSTPTPTQTANGVTGRLSIDSLGHVSRELLWARFVDGRPQLLVGEPIKAAQPPIARN